MIIDLDSFEDGNALRASVCIAGAGAAGITLALELGKAGIDVLLLESGSFKPEKETQALYEGYVADEHLHSPLDRYRQRRFGGTTTIWGGRCMPLDDIDFEIRDYVPDSGWPITKEAILPYYPAANRLCEAGHYSYTAQESFGSPSREMISGFVGRHFSSNSLERFSCPTDFGNRYLHKLRTFPNVRVVLHANVVQINLDSSASRAKSLAIRTIRGKQLTACADHFVLATGGLETPRLLLASRDVQHDGVGNQHDLVGRYYMCHLAGTIGELTFNGPLESVCHGYERSEEGIYCRRRLALSCESQKANGIGNFVARLHHPRITNPAHRNSVLSLLYLARPIVPYEYAKRLYDQESYDLVSMLQHVWNIVSSPFDAIGFSWHILHDRFLAQRKFPSIIVEPKVNLFSLDFHAEQFPNRDSRISLANDRDALGLPRIMVDWRYTPEDVRSVSSALALLSQDIVNSGVGCFFYDQESVETEITRYGAYGGHHIGTTRMGNDPKTSVVDANCRIHSVENVFVAGSSVFPTSSQANPTLTIVALALRLADHLASEMKKSP